MAMTAVSSASIIGDIVIKLKTLLTTNLASGTVYTAYPHKSVDYPYITITHAGFRDEHVAIGTEYKRAFITVRIEVWSQSTKERDEIWDDIYDELRHHYITLDGSGDSITSIRLFDPVILSCMDIDTDSPRGSGHIHRKISEIQFTFYATS